MIEIQLALLLLSIVALATTSMLVGVAGTFATKQYQTSVAHATLGVAQKLRQSVWMSGYGLAVAESEVTIQGNAPRTGLGLRYRIDNASVFNRYDCSRSSSAGKRTNFWQVRGAVYPGARAELICQGRVLDIHNQQVLGLDARTTGRANTLLAPVGNWRYGQVQAIEVDLLLQHPRHQPRTLPSSHPFAWQGIGENTEAPMVWTRLRLPIAFDLDTR